MLNTLESQILGICHFLAQYVIDVFDDYPLNFQPFS